MPIVEHSGLPTFGDLRRQGLTVLSLEDAQRQDIRALHVGLLNLMPDAAFQLTEQQFMRLVGGSNQIAQFYVHCFTVDGLPRGAATRAYIAENYEDLRLDLCPGTGCADRYRGQRRQPSHRAGTVLPGP